MADTPLLDRVGTAFSRLSDSEKRLVTLLGSVMVVFVLVGAVLLMNGQVDKRKKRVALRMEEMSQLEVLKVQYDEATQLERRSQAKLSANAISLFSVIKNAANDVGIVVPDLQERRTPVKDSDVVELSVDLTIKEVSIDRLQALMEKLEGKRADQPVKVTKLKVKPRFDNPEMLEASMSVSTWKTDPKLAGDKGGAP